MVKPESAIPFLDLCLTFKKKIQRIRKASDGSLLRVPINIRRRAEPLASLLVFLHVHQKDKCLLEKWGFLHRRARAVVPVGPRHSGVVLCSKWTGLWSGCPRSLETIQSLPQSEWKIKKTWFSQRWHIPKTTGVLSVCLHVFISMK